MKKGTSIIGGVDWKFKIEIRKTHGVKAIKQQRAFPVEYYAVIKGFNGEIVFTGETRKSRYGLVKTINNLFPGVEIVNAK